MTKERALLTRLVETWDDPANASYSNLYFASNKIIADARALLAEPEGEDCPEGLVEELIDDLEGALNLHVDPDDWWEPTQTQKNAIATAKAALLAACRSPLSRAEAKGMVEEYRAASLQRARLYGCSPETHSAATEREHKAKSALLAALTQGREG